MSFTSYTRKLASIRENIEHPGCAGCHKGSGERPRLGGAAAFIFCRRGSCAHGMAIRAVERITGFAKTLFAVLRVGERCARFFTATVPDLKVDDAQCDEIHSFVGMRDRIRMLKNRSPECGDSWTWIAIERNTKMVLAFQVGDRHNSEASRFFRKLNDATTGHFRISIDGLGIYRTKVPETFGTRVTHDPLRPRCDSGR